MPPLGLEMVVILWFGGWLAGFVDSIAGGGGIISVPVLLAVGIPPHTALGTNKLQSSFGSFTATLNYARKGLVSPREMVSGISFTALGAVLGTLTIQLLPADFLRHIIPVLLLAVFVYTLLTPQLGALDGPRRMPARLFYLVFGLALGFYDGFFGPGTGSFWTVAFVLLLGLNLKHGTAHTKVTNFTSNVVSLGVFVLSGKVYYAAGLVMATGQIVGAFMGSRMVIMHEVKFVRWFFLGVVGLTILKLAWSTYYAVAHGLRTS